MKPQIVDRVRRLRRLREDVLGSARDDQHRFIRRAAAIKREIGAACRLRLQ